MDRRSQFRARRSASGLLVAALLSACASVAPSESSATAESSRSPESPSTSSVSTSDRERLEADLEALEEEVATLQVRVERLESEKASLEDGLAEALSPGPSPAANAEVTVNWVRWVTPDQPSTVVCVTIENTSDSSSLFYSNSQFTAFDGDGFSYPIVANPFFLTIPLESGELGPGELRRGQIPFNVPPTSWPLTSMVWEDGIEATTEVTVDLPAPADWTNADHC